MTLTLTLLPLLNTSLRVSSLLHLPPHPTRRYLFTTLHFTFCRRKDAYFIIRAVRQNLLGRLNQGDISGNWTGRDKEGLQIFNRNAAVMKPKCAWEVNIKTDIEIGCDVVD